MPPTTSRRPRAHAALLGLGLFGLGLLAAVPAAAQDSPNATAKLIQILIAKGILSKDQAASVLSEAESEGRATRTARPHAKTGQGALATAEPPAPPPGTVRVPYVPQTVRDQIAAQVRDEVLGTAKAENWAAPNALPEWTKRITVYGDVRTRYERDFFDKANGGLTGASGEPPFPDFTAINNGTGFDTNVGQGGTNQFAQLPTINTSEDRNRFRLRARIGVKAVLNDYIGTDIRIATGSDNSPVSTNQTLGQGTNFGKYALWLDRAYIDIHAPPDSLDPGQALKAWFGRSPNPFWTSDLVYSSELNFDGFSIQGVQPITRGVKGWLTAGAFPVFNTDFNFSTTAGGALSPNKLPSRDKYLFAAQLGSDLRYNDDWNGKAAVGIFAYTNIQGKVSSPCFTLSAAETCDTDNSRPQFRQFGNTLFPIRSLLGNIDPATGNQTNPSPEYYGLASKFDVLDLHGAVSYAHYLPYLITLEGEFDKNLAFNRSHVIAKGPANNGGGIFLANGTGGDLATGTGPYQGGDTAYFVKLQVGPLAVKERNQWNAYVAYKYLESDSVVDAFDDSDFHLGGTNAKGFILGGAYGVAHNTFLQARWLSSREVAGPRYRNDVVQLDLNAQF